MKTSIVVLTLDGALSRLIGLKKTSFIPSELRKRYPQVSIIPYLASAETTAESLAPYFSELNGDGVILLCDNRLARLIQALGTPFFTVIFDNSLGGKLPHNYFGMVLSRILKAFFAFEDRFDNQKLRKLFVLPLKNFDATELRQLHALFRSGVNVDGEFVSSVDRLLSELRNRQRPKTDKGYSKRYFVDDQIRYYELGHEVHAQLETGIPPHSSLCSANGIFRFGKRYDSERHFNVSREGERISGTFQDCHGGSAELHQCSHINMFANDFYKPK